MFLLKFHYKYQYKVLSSIAGIDFAHKKTRFQIAYDLLSLKYNSRMRVKILTEELTPVDSIENVYKAASWWECEVWDMFGVYFLNNQDLHRILTDYGFYGYPLRKDFPLSGFSEKRYNPIKDRIVSERVQLSQEYRYFELGSAWDKLVIKMKNKNWV